MVAFDHLLQQFYDSIEQVGLTTDFNYYQYCCQILIQEWTKKGVAERMTIISIAGGHMDMMIPAHLTVQNYSLNIAVGVPALPCVSLAVFCPSFPSLSSSHHKKPSRQQQYRGTGPIQGIRLLSGELPPPQVHVIVYDLACELM